METRPEYCPTPASAYSPMPSPLHVSLPDPPTSLDTIALQRTPPSDTRGTVELVQGRTESAAGLEVEASVKGQYDGNGAAIEISTAQFDGTSDRKLKKNGDIDPSYVRTEPDGDEIRHQLGAAATNGKEQTPSAAGASTIEGGTGQVLYEHKRENNINQVQSSKDQEYLSQNLEAKSLGKPVRFPDSYHQQVLAESIEQGANHDQQMAILAGLRGVERMATLSQLAEGTGAIEVEASELEGTSAIQPPAPYPSSTSGQEDNRDSRKRKNGEEHHVAPKKRASTAKDIIALSNEQHLANGWKELPQSHFRKMKVPELKQYLRTIEQCKKWWNGLGKEAIIKKIMDWQADMKEVAATNQADSDNDDFTSADGEDEKEPMLTDSKIHVEANGPEAPLSSPLPSDALKQGQHSRASDTMIETPVRQTEGSNFVRSSPASQDSQHKLFYDPTASRRDSPLVQKFEAVQMEAMLERAQSQDAQFEAVGYSPPSHVQSESSGGVSKPAAKDDGTTARRHDDMKLEHGV